MSVVVRLLLSFEIPVKLNLGNLDHPVFLVPKGIQPWMSASVAMPFGLSRQNESINLDWWCFGFCHFFLNLFSQLVSK